MDINMTDAGAASNLSRNQAAAVRHYRMAAFAANTQRAYRADLSALVTWGLPLPITPLQLAAYLADQATSLSPYTLRRRLCAVRRAHQLTDAADPSRHPLVREVMAGIWRTHGHGQRQAAALTLEAIPQLLAPMRGDRGVRDRALILVGFAAALRRSELVSLDIDDVEFGSRGVLLRIRHSKTDKRSAGRVVAVPYARGAPCAVAALQDCLRASPTSSGPVFRSMDRTGTLHGRLSAQSVSLILKGRARTAGLEPARLSAHSLRAGFVTCAVHAGVSLVSIQQQTGHRSIDMVARYVRAADPFLNNPYGALQTTLTGDASASDHAGRAIASRPGEHFVPRWS